MKDRREPVKEKNGSGTGIGTLTPTCAQMSRTDDAKDGGGQSRKHLSDVDLVLVLPGGGARVGEDGSAVAVRVRVDELDRLVERVHRHAQQHRTEDFLLR
jgi:hypothetical protein